MSVLLLLASFAVILAGALMFTNAIEWMGHRLGLGEGAVGSLLAAVGTAMPETLIPVVAIIGGEEGAEDVAVGAIIGAPFLLATIAMALIGTSAYLYRSRRPQGLKLKAHMETLERDLAFFLIFFALGLGLGMGVPNAVQIPAALAFLFAYAVYVRMTLRRSGDIQAEETLSPLIMDRRAHRRGSEPPTSTVVIQILVGLGAIVGGAQLFIEELLTVADSLGVEALILSLVLAPLATELPEKANSFFWIRDGKDSLALGNVTGAMVFQSTIPVALGLAFTSWELDRFASVSALLGLAGGVVAVIALRTSGRFRLWAVITWGLLYATFLAYVLGA